MTYVLATDAAGRRGLYEGGKLVATWDRRETQKQIVRQIEARAGREAEYTEREVAELVSELEGEAPRRRPGRPRKTPEPETPAVEGADAE